MKVKRTSYDNEPTILMFAGADFVARTALINDSGNLIEANEEGRKIIPAGTVLDESGGVAPESMTMGCFGLLLHSVDVTDGPVSGTILVEGHVNSLKLPKMVPPTQQEVLKGIIFHMVG